MSEKPASHISRLSLRFFSDKQDREMAFLDMQALLWISRFGRKYWILWRTSWDWPGFVSSKIPNENILKFGIFRRNCFEPCCFVCECIDRKSFTRLTVESQVAITEQVWRVCSRLYKQKKSRWRSKVFTARRDFLLRAFGFFYCWWKPHLGKTAVEKLRNSKVRDISI